MDNFSNRLNPWNYDISKVGKTTTLAGEFEMDWGLPGVFIGFALFALLLVALGELLTGVGGIFGILIAIGADPPCRRGVVGGFVQRRLGRDRSGGDDGPGDRRRPGDRRPRSRRADQGD